MVVDGDKCDGATRCDDDDNHPYPIVTNAIIVDIGLVHHIAVSVVNCTAK